ncbi:enoyl-CoA delta isomerase 2, mitochondrial-like [Drosophila subobscura]|uniref:enoyl-CoA delta isomerase 2, mitochondrial-like n=1 Tax=Drosophila subobscura TaxID=7241 RepID=UPI00155AB86A|nr:enoyl-CoA delta isomerase 2, mitochondrial-like [Drosophila subobscura]
MAAYQGYQELLVQKQEKLLLVKFNNPKKKNCLNRVAYQELARVLGEVNDDGDVTIVVFTGVGDFFTAGNNLSPSGQTDDIQAYLVESNKIFKDMVLGFINCNKIVISLVNGPAIGIGATIVGLSDVAWCAEEAYFYAPFTKLGLVPEGGSSYMLPRILGRSKASEMLLLNEKLSSAEAYSFNFVSRVYKTEELDSVVWPKLREFSTLPPISLKEGKSLIREGFLASLLKANDAECTELINRFQGDEFIQAIMDFATRKSKL